MPGSKTNVNVVLKEHWVSCLVHELNGSGIFALAARTGTHSREPVAPSKMGDVPFSEMGACSRTWTESRRLGVVSVSKVFVVRRLDSFPLVGELDPVGMLSFSVVVISQDLFEPVSLSCRAAHI
jgi:hypothetical protein